MRTFRKAALAGAAAVFALTAGLAAYAQDAAAPPRPARAPRQVMYAWAPRPVPVTGWVAPNKPIWRIAEILAAHKGEKNWTQDIVRDRDYTAKYIQMAPGESTKPQFWADDRIFWAIYSGSVRFTIQGQAPFVATKGFLVQVPYRNVYSMETVGDEPSVRFEVTRTGRTPVYPATADKTVAPTGKGVDYIKSSYNVVPDKYDDKNKPYVDFLKDYVNNPAGAPRGDHAFVSDTMNFMNIIRGHGVPTPPDSNKGHFHIDYNEFWYIAEGDIDYKMEGMPTYTAHTGDIVYAPQGRWHRASYGGTGMDTRIAINPRPDGMHNYDPAAGASQ